MKTRGKIIIAVMAMLLLLAGVAYLLLVRLVMPDFYRARLPENLASRVTGAGLFEVRLGNLTFDGLQVKETTLKFNPGAGKPCAILLDGINAECRVTPDDTILINDLPLNELFPKLRSSLDDLPITELRAVNCRLSGGPDIELRVKLNGADWRYYDTVLKSTDRAHPFQLRITCAEEAPEQLRILLDGRFDLSVLLKTLSIFKLPVLPPACTAGGEAELHGYAVISRNSTIHSARLNVLPQNAEIACGLLCMKGDANTRIAYSRERGQITLTLSNLFIDAPARFKLKNFTATLPERGSRTANFSGQLELRGGRLGELELLSAENFDHTFRGTYTPENGLWTAWSESGKVPAEIILKDTDRLLRMSLGGYEWSGNGRAAETGDFNLSVKNTRLTVTGDREQQSFDGVALNLNGELGNGGKSLEIRGEFGIKQASGDIFTLNQLGGKTTLSVKDNSLDGKFEARAANFSCRDYTLDNATLSGDFNLELNASLKNASFKGTLSAADATQPLGPYPLNWKKPSLNAELRFSPGGELQQLALDGSSESVSWDMFTLETPRGKGGLDNGKIAADISFGKSSAGLDGHRVFSPEGRIKVEGACKDGSVKLESSLETVELWYLGENVSGKFDRVRLDGTISPEEVALRFEASESNAESKGGKLRSAKVTGKYSNIYSQALQRWEADRVLSGIQFQNLELSTENLAALCPSLQITPDALTVRDATLTAGPLQFQKVSLRQAIPGNGRLTVGEFITGGLRQGTLEAATALTPDAWSFKGSLPLNALNQTPMSFKGSLTWPELKPHLSAQYRIANFAFQRPVELNFLNPDWKGIKLSGSGNWQGEFDAFASEILHKGTATLKNAALFGGNWAMDSIKGTLELIDLGQCLTAPHQALTFGNMIIGGYELSAGSMVFHAVTADRFLLEHAEFNALGGRLTTIQPAEFKPSAPAANLKLYAENLDLPPLLSILGVPEATGQAKAAGIMPVEFSGGRVVFHDARLSSLDGTLKLQGLEKFDAGAPQELIRNGNIPFIQAVLKDFIYRRLEIILNPESIRLRGTGRPAANVPYRYDSAGRRFVRVAPIDGIGSELELDTEIRH